MNRDDLKDDELQWKLLAKETPHEGYTGVVLINGFKDKLLPKDEYYTDLGVYCDGTWYKLSYDDHLGVLRKVPVKGNVLAYTRALIPKWDDLVE